MSSRAARIALLGNVGVGNHGNDASLDALRETFARIAPSAQLSCICPLVADLEGRPLAQESLHAPRGAGLSGRLFGKAADIGHAARAVKQFDLLALPGTGLLDIGKRESSLGWPYALWCWARAARAAGVPYWIVSMGCSRPPNALTGALLRAVVQGAAYLSFRDSYSRDAALALGAPTDAAIVPDLVFGLSAAPAAGGPAQRIVGLGVMAGRAADEARYANELVKLAEGLRAREYGVRLLIGEDKDAPFRDAIQARAPFSEAPAIGGVPDLIAAISGASAVIGTRFHNIISALKLGLPTLCISYDARHRELMERFGLDAFYSEIDTFAHQDVLAQFDAAMAERATLAARISVCAQRAKEELAAQEALLAARLS